MENLNELSQYLNTEIVCTLAGLGYAEGTEYFKSPDCLESLKDLIRFLRRDDTTCEVRRQLGCSEVLQNDLMAILKSCTSKDKETFDMVIRLMVNLTQPAVLCFGGNIPDDKTGRHYYLELVTQLQAYKEAFTEKEVLAVIGQELAKLLQMGWDDREEEDYLLIERILLLLRNILHVPADPQAEKRTDDDASIHDQVIWNFHVNGIDDLLLYIASSPDERRWCMHTLEIISLMLREQKPESLARAGEGRSLSEKNEDKRELEFLRHHELSEKKKNVKKFSGRHSRFGGSFYVQNMKSITEKPLIYHRTLAEAKNMNFDREKTAPKKRKKQMLAKEMGTERKSTLSIRLFLRDFSKQFLQHCYNPLLYAARDNLAHERSQENDESYFLWALRFFMEFSRHHEFRVDYVCETISIASFNYMLQVLTKFYTSFLEDKENSVTWGRRLHLALQAYKELIMYVLFMDTSEDQNLKEYAKKLKGNLFYMVEFRDIFMILLRKFDKCKQTKSYLRDLIDTFHVFLKMLERFCSEKHHVIVKAKKKKRTKRKRRQERGYTAPTDEEWQGLTSDLSALLQGRAGLVPECDESPFDNTLEESEEEQKNKCLYKIQEYLKGSKPDQATALLRAAREFWPGDQFGSSDIDAESEFMCLHDIFKTDFSAIAALDETGNVPEDGEEELPPDEEEVAAATTKEIEFDIKDFLNKLSTPAILQPYCWMLQFYKENSEKTNHSIVKMLHRVAVDLKMPAMLFQISLFCSFNKILCDPAVTRYKELSKFAKHILCKFFELLPKNPVLLAELVAWKSAGVCYEISEGYGSLAARPVKPSATSWTFEEEDELRQLYEEHRGSDDVVDAILDRLTNESRTRRQVQNKLVTMRLVQDRKELHKKAEKKKAWSEEEEEQLRALYDEYRGSEGEDVVEKIMEHMLNSNRTRRQVVNQLVKLGVVADRKELRKKKAKGTKQRKKKNAELEEEGFINDEESDSEGEESDGAQEEHDSESESEEDEDDMTSGAPLSAMIKKLRDSGLGGQVKWIQSKLRGAADDRQEEETWQPLPLVTITEEHEEALKKRLFKRVLRHVGLVPPANEQESFWRIPASLSPADLRKSADNLDAAENDDEGGAPSETSPVTNKKSQARKEKLAVLAARKKSGSDRKRKRERGKRHNEQPDQRRDTARKKSGKSWREMLNEEHPEGDRESNDDSDVELGRENREQNTNETPGSAGSKKTEEKQRGNKSRRRVRTFSDSDEETNDRDDGGHHENEANTPEKAKATESSDEDSDEEPLAMSLSKAKRKNSGEAGRKRPREEDTDDESDDEEDFALPLAQYKKVRRVLDDDDDE